MGLISSIIGAGMKAAGSIASGIAGKKAYNAIKARTEAAQQANRNWYDREYNADATQRADAQRLLTMTEESIRNRNKQSAGAAAVMGGTEESVAAAKAANNQALTDAVSGINAQADARKDSIRQQYVAQANSLNEQLNAADNSRAEQVAQSVQGVAGASQGIMSAFKK